MCAVLPGVPITAFLLHLILLVHEDRLAAMIMKLMLVEDDPAIQRLYERAFMAEGFEVMLANDGTIVYETIRLHRPNIVVMDVMMPNFNGLKTLEELKSNYDTRGIPVVMLSANNDSDVVQKALQLGAVRYLFKDKLEPTEVVRIVKEVADSPN